MNQQTNENRIGLSRPGRSRRQHMLTELQDELTSIHHARAARRRRRRFGSTSACMLAVVLLVIANQASFEGQPVATVPANSPGWSTNILPAGPSNLPAYFSQARNNDGVVNRFVVRSHEPSIKMVKINNTELLELLDAAGKPSVLGIIRGELTVIPSTALATNSSGQLLFSD